MSQRSLRRSECGDPGFERDLLDSSSLAAWKGLPLAWVEADPHEVVGEHFIGRHALVTIDRGAMQTEVRWGRRASAWDLSAGSIGCFAAGTHFSSSRWRWSHARRIAVDLDAGSTLAPDLFDGPARAPRLRTEIEFRDPALSAVLQCMVEEVGAGCPNGSLYAESLSLGVLMRLQRRGSDPSVLVHERGRLSARQLQVVREQVLESLGRSLEIRTLAEACGFSASQFTRLFRQTIGCSPYRYVQQLRLERARELVLASERELAAIADETGFASQSHMTTAFVRVFGRPPGTLRREARLSVLVEG